MLVPQPVAKELLETFPAFSTASGACVGQAGSCWPCLTDSGEIELTTACKFRPALPHSRSSGTSIGTRDTEALCWSADRLRPDREGRSDFPFGAAWRSHAPHIVFAGDPAGWADRSNILLAKVSRGSKTTDGKKGLLELSSEVRKCNENVVQNTAAAPLAVGAAGRSASAIHVHDQ